MAASPESFQSLSGPGRPLRLWVRPLVPVMPLQMDELCWLHPPVRPTPLQDPSPAGRTNASSPPEAPSVQPVENPSTSKAVGEVSSKESQARPQQEFSRQITKEGAVQTPSPTAAAKESSQGEGQLLGHTASQGGSQENLQCESRVQLQSGTPMAEAGKERKAESAEGEGRVPPEEALAGLVSASLAGPLSPEQEQVLLSAIASESGFKAVCCSLTPSQFPDVVNQNPSVATDLILKMRSPGSSSLKDYANFEAALMRMELTLQSIEVVNRIVAAMDSPIGFVLDYISYCIATCTDIKDKTVQSRQVRLLCMFIQLQLRNKTIHVHDVFIEVQAFCIEFSRIKEAAGLFKLLKSLDKE